MKTQEGTINIDLVLNELHAKRKWLDTVIAGLESAIQSPDHRLIESLSATYPHDGKRRPKVDLRSRQQASLSRLASRVQRHTARKQSQLSDDSANT